MENARLGPDMWPTATGNERTQLPLRNPGRPRKRRQVLLAQQGQDHRRPPVPVRSLVFRINGLGVALEPGLHLLKLVRLLADVSQIGLLNHASP